MPRRGGTMPLSARLAVAEYQASIPKEERQRRGRKSAETYKSRVSEEELSERMRLCGLIGGAHNASLPEGVMKGRGLLGAQARAAKYASGELEYKICSIEGCERKRKSSGLCKFHLGRKRADAERRGVPFDQGDPLAISPHQRNNPCKIEGCSGIARRYGWCMDHWQEERVKRRKIRHPYGAPQKFLEELFSRNTDKCIWWPFGSRSRIVYGGSQKDVPRIICERLYGMPPTLKHQASHVCNHGHLGCVNPKHLLWETSFQQADRIRQRVSTNSTSKLHKLTAEKLQLILKQKGKRPPPEIADIFDVDEDTVIAVFDSLDN